MPYSCTRKRPKGRKPRKKRREPEMQSMGEGRFGVSVPQGFDCINVILFYCSICHKLLHMSAQLRQHGSFPKQGEFEWLRPLQ